VSLTKQPQKKRNPKKKLTPEEVFQREWQRVQKLQKKNGNQQAEIEALIKQIRPFIEDNERKLATTFYHQTEKMLVLFQRKSLPQWCKEELVDWLSFNLDTLLQQPFTDHLDLAALIKQVRTLYSSLLPEPGPEFFDAFDEDPQQQNQRSENDSKSKAEQKTEKHREAPIDDMFDDLFDEFGNAQEQDAEDDAADDDFFEDMFEQWEQMFDAEEDKEKQKNKELDKLLRASNINKIFRKIARILHPDKEADPEKKELRHQQMSELLKARDEKNITALFGLYAEHVGKAPLEELGEDIDSATRLLKHQAQALREEQDKFETGDPLKAYIFHHFGKLRQKKMPAIKQSVKRHNQFIEEALGEQRHLLKSMSSIRTIKPLLDDRREFRMIEEMGMEFF